jgi:hypothetical protein
MSRALMLLLLAMALAFGCLGCGGESSAPGSVTVTSTAPFQSLKSVKPPPPKVPAR